MNKVIFLDVDGVLNSTKSCEFYHKKYGGNGYGGFFGESEEPTLENVLWDEECVGWFDKIVKETGASIVISSTWRKYYGLLAFHSMFKLYNVFDLDIIGKTKQKGFIGRGKEIQDFIEENNVKNYVILDDDSDMLESQMSNFVNTDCDLGLTKNDYLKAVKILGSVV